MTDSGFGKIKNMIKAVGGKVVIVEKGEPAIVVMSMEEYLRSTGGERKYRGFNLPQNGESVERVNKEINIWKNRQEERRLRQLEISNSYRAKSDLEEKDNNEIVVKKL